MNIIINISINITLKYCNIITKYIGTISRTSTLNNKKK